MKKAKQNQLILNRIRFNGSMATKATKHQQKLHWLRALLYVPFERQRKDQRIELNRIQCVFLSDFCLPSSLSFIYYCAIPLQY